MKYDRKVAEDFCKALEESKVVMPNSHKNPKVIDTILEIINLTESQARKENATVNMFYSEFTDWIETYKQVA